jgi:hypothetical protein
MMGCYWVVALGDITGDQYPWAIVSAPFRSSSFILARNVNTFRSDYEQEALKKAADLGFTSDANKPLPTYQGDDCDYFSGEMTCHMTTEDSQSSSKDEDNSKEHRRKTRSRKKKWGFHFQIM